MFKNFNQIRSLYSSKLYISTTTFLFVDNLFIWILVWLIQMSTPWYYIQRDIPIMWKLSSNNEWRNIKSNKTKRKRNTWESRHPDCCDMLLRAEKRSFGIPNVTKTSDNVTTSCQREHDSIHRDKNKYILHWCGSRNDSTRIEYFVANTVYSMMILSKTRDTTRRPAMPR